MERDRFSFDFNKNVRTFSSVLRTEESFDLIARKINFASGEAELFYVDGLCREETVEKIISVLHSADETGVKQMKGAGELAAAFVTFGEARVTDDIQSAAASVFCGSAAIIAGGFCEAVLVDIRQAPLRSMDEPQSDRVLRGPHDGFVESLSTNASLIRRRIRDPELTMELHCVGSESRSDVVICYMTGKVSEKQLGVLRKKLDNIKVKSLTMNQQSLLECLAPGHRVNPFPRVRFTERPDCTCACVLEGGMVLMMENTPVVMLLPTGIFDFLQDTNDFYLSPCVGGYIRMIRFIIILLTVFLTPCWFLLINNPDSIPPWLDFIRIEEQNTVPVFAQLLIVEAVIDALKLASINTPSALNNSFSVLGALVLGEFAVRSGWFVSEVVLYMAFVAITDFCQPNVEFGYTMKLSRLLLLCLIRFFGVWGLPAGVIIIIILAASTKTVTGTCYFYPLVPFDGKRLSAMIFRKQKKG